MGGWNEGRIPVEFLAHPVLYRNWLQRRYRDHLTLGPLTDLKPRNDHTRERRVVDDHSSTKAHVTRFLEFKLRNFCLSTTEL